MSSSVVSRKRKADALEADDSATDGTRKPAPDDSPAHLPAPCLAAVLNFMWYTDVRQCMLAGKMMAVEAARHVETLNITKASELVVPAARRFGNVTTVNVLSLISEISEDNRDDQISMDTVIQVVPFLTSIPNLKRVCLGGLYGHQSLLSDGEAVWYRYDYSADGVVEPREHQAIFKTLIQNIIGGFQSKSLPQHLELHGILDHGQLECAGRGEHPHNPCRFCRKILSSFPLRSLVIPISVDWAFCVSRVDCIRILLCRDGAAATFRSSNVGADMLLRCFRNVIFSVARSLWMSSEREVDQAFIKKMRDQGASNMTVYGNASLGKSFKDLLDLVKSSPLLQEIIKGIPRSRLFESSILGAKDGKTMLVRRVFEALLEAGFNLNESDCIIVDPEKEPALARLMNEK